MGALHLAIILLTSLRAVDGFAKTLKQPSEHLSVEQELALQDRKTAPALAQVSTKDDDSPSPDPADENQSITLPSWSSVEAISKPGLILSKNAPCSPANHPTSKPKRRGLKQRQGATPKPKLFCPLPSAATTTTTDTDSQPSKNDGPDGQQPQTKKGQELAPPDGSPPQPEEFKWPNMFKIPTNDGDSPACFEATNGQMPVGVCENPEQLPEPSRWDVFFQFNIDVEPRAWKLPDATLGAYLFPFPLPPYPSQGQSNFPHMHCIVHTSFPRQLSPFIPPPSPRVPSPKPPPLLYHFPTLIQ